MDEVISSMTTYITEKIKVDPVLKQELVDKWEIIDENGQFTKKFDEDINEIRERWDYLRYQKCQTDTNSCIKMGCAGKCKIKKIGVG